MKKLVFILTLLFAHLTHAQDSTKIIYSEEPDTLAEQRFIDQFDNVFMTKVPTRHMAKIGLQMIPGLTSGFQSDVLYNLNLFAGYEYKLAPAFSIGVNFSVNAPTSNLGKFFTSSVQARWYYDMRERIRSGKSANNFSGNYISPVFEKQWRKEYGHFQMTRLGLEFGVQRRFLNNGFVDFAIGAFYENYSGGFFSNIFYVDNNKIRDFTISTRTNLGLGFGDWKRARNLPICELMRCDAFLGSQFKVLWPVLSIGTRLQKGSFGVGYEKKIGKSPVSVNANFYADIQSISTKLLPKNSGYANQHYQIQPSVQVRYYYLQRKKIMNGNGGNNLSGIYAGPYSDYIKYTSFNEAHSPVREHLGVGFSFGYQKTFYRKVYFDVSGSMSWNLLETPQYNSNHIATVRMGFGLAI